MDLKYEPFEEGRSRIRRVYELMGCVDEGFEG